MFKFIHAADLHLDSPLRGLARYEGAPAGEIRGATRRALENLVHVALEEEVQFVLIAGDVYDGDWRDHNTGLFFAKQMGRLRAAGIPVYLIAGNHDAQSVMTKHLQLPDNVHVFPAKKAGTFQVPGLDAAIHGQGFATKSVTADLTAAYPRAVPNAYNIGLLHTSLTGYEGHDNYAPCTVEGLKHLDYDYWALGHIHQQECIHADAPAIWFPGNLQGRHIRETGPKGCLVVAVDNKGLHEIDFRTLDVVRWAELVVDVSGCAAVEACVEVFVGALEAALETCGERMLAARVVVTGTTQAHDALLARTAQFTNEIRNAANIHGDDRVWIEKVRIATRPAGDAPAAFDDGPLAALAEVVAAIREDEASRAELFRELASLAEKLPPELRDEEGLALDDPDRLSEWLEQAGPLLRAQWNTAEGGP